MRLFGGWLPFIGFRDEPVVDEEMRRFFELPPGAKVMKTFQLEWLHNGIVIPLHEPDE